MTKIFQKRTNPFLPKNVFSVSTINKGTSPAQVSHLLYIDVVRLVNLQLIRSFYCTQIIFAYYFFFRHWLLVIHKSKQIILQFKMGSIILRILFFDQITTNENQISFLILQLTSNRKDSDEPMDQVHALLDAID